MGHREGFPLVGTSPGSPGPGERVSVEIVQDKSWDGGGDMVEPKQAFWQGMKVPANVRKADGAGGVHRAPMSSGGGWLGRLDGKIPMGGGGGSSSRGITCVLFPPHSYTPYFHLWRRAQGLYKPIDTHSCSLASSTLCLYII